MKPISQSLSSSLKTLSTKNSKKFLQKQILLQQILQDWMIWREDLNFFQSNQSENNPNYQPAFKNFYPQKVAWTDKGLAAYFLLPLLSIGSSLTFSESAKIPLMVSKTNGEKQNPHDPFLGKFNLQLMSKAFYANDGLDKLSTFHNSANLSESLPTLKSFSFLPLQGSSETSQALTLSTVFKDSNFHASNSALALVRSKQNTQLTNKFQQRTSSFPLLGTKLSLYPIRQNSELKNQPIDQFRDAEVFLDQVNHLSEIVFDSEKIEQCFKFPTLQFEEMDSFKPLLTTNSMQEILHSDQNWNLFITEEKTQKSLKDGSYPLIFIETILENAKEFGAKSQHNFENENRFFLEQMNHRLHSVLSSSKHSIDFGKKKSQINASVDNNNNLRSPISDSVLSLFSPQLEARKLLTNLFSENSTKMRKEQVVVYELPLLHTLNVPIKDPNFLKSTNNLSSFKTFNSPSELPSVRILSEGQHKLFQKPLNFEKLQTDALNFEVWVNQTQHKRPFFQDLSSKTQFSLESGLSLDNANFFLEPLSIQDQKTLKSTLEMQSSKSQQALTISSRPTVENFVTEIQNSIQRLFLNNSLFLKKGWKNYNFNSVNLESIYTFENENFQKQFLINEGGQSSLTNLTTQKSRYFEKILRSYLSTKSKGSKVKQKINKDKDFSNFAKSSKVNEWLVLKNYLKQERHQVQLKKQSVKIQSVSSPKIQAKNAFERKPTWILKSHHMFELTKEELKQTHLENLKEIEILKTQQKHRRRKKLRKENRRRKKRKRFYPRPLWLRSLSYEKFLNFRHPLSLTQSSVLLTKSKMPGKSQIRHLLQNSNFSSPFSTQRWVDSNKILKGLNLTEIRAAELRDQPTFLQSKFYTIPKFVLFDFQNAMLKSNWFKSNLDSYIGRVQESLVKAKEHQKQDQFLAHFEKNLEFFFPILSTSLESLQWNSDSRVEESFGLKNETYANWTQYEKMIQQRLLRVIKNIKLNVNLNGSLRPRPTPIGHGKHQKLKNSPVWSFLTNLLNGEILNQTPSIYSFYPSLRLHWGAAQSGSFDLNWNSQMNQIWKRTKYRDQQKTNPTKRGLWKFQQNLQKLSWQAANPFLATENFVASQKLKNQEEKLATLIPWKIQSISLWNQNLPIQKPHSTEFFWWQNSTLQTPSDIPWKLTMPQLFGSGMISQTTQPTFLFEVNGFTQNSTKSQIMNFALWAGMLGIHLAAFLSLLQIAQIRDLVKFTGLVVLKVSTIYLDLILALGRFLTLSKKEFLTSFDPLTVQQFGSNPGTNTQNIDAILSQGSSSQALQEIQKSQMSLDVSSLSLSTVAFLSHQNRASQQLNLSESKSKEEIQYQMQKLSFYQIKTTQLVANSLFETQKFSYQLLSFGVELGQNWLAFFYQFLEKPAEFVVDWLGSIFLVEWSADLRTYLPENLENQMSLISTKMTRPLSLLGLPGLFLQKRFELVLEDFLNSLTGYDSDLQERQRKGQIFWESWGEILVEASDRYQFNLASLTTLKDEQDRLFDALLSESKESWLRQENQAPLKLQPIFGPESAMLTYILKTSSDSIQDLNLLEPLAYWGISQTLTYPAKESDLFIEISPAKSFQSLSFVENSTSLLAPLGSMVCSGYAGIFSNQISKNLLIVGEPGREKTAFIEALAGEAEMKLMIDNAARYANIQRGVAVGMKMLRDVFESLVLHTPALFLIEDIHLIGEKRALILSEDEGVTMNDRFFSATQDEFHEKNQAIAQAKRHNMIHYQKPYKGDFSLSILANRFRSQLLVSVAVPQRRTLGRTPRSPLLQFENFQSQIEQDKEKPSVQAGPKFQAFLSSLQKPKERSFAPPATSPFTVLLLKETKKFKPTQTVKEASWLPNAAEMNMSASKVQYSVRAKVALLADLTISSLSTKLDMITDLLVIIDSVRSTRGFMVFATTHLPAKLDPALRRPGRLDETFYISNFTSLKNRLNFFKVQVFNAPILSQIPYETQWISSSLFPYQLSKTFDLFDFSQDWFAYGNRMDSGEALKESLKLRLLDQSISGSPTLNKNRSFDQKIENILGVNSFKLQNLPKLTRMNREKTGQNWNRMKFQIHLLMSTYSCAAEIFVRRFLSREIMPLKYWALSYSGKGTSGKNRIQQNADLLYGSPQDLKGNHGLLAQTIGSLFPITPFKLQLGTSMAESSFVFGNSKNLRHLFIQTVGMREFMNSQPLFQTLASSQVSRPQAFGGFASSNIQTFLYQRSVWSQNVMLTEFLEFENQQVFKQPSGPPFTTLVNSLKNWENFRKMDRDFQSRLYPNIQEKIQFHQQQRLMKELAGVKTVTQSKSTSQHSESTRELIYLDSILDKPTSIFSHYHQTFGLRHRAYSLNQWWNAHLSEQNLETTFLSDVDWRARFFESTNTDVSIDFPDPEHYYNPRFRRWFVSTGHWQHWSPTQTETLNQINQHVSLEKFSRLFNQLNLQREMLDSLAYTLMTQGTVNEWTLLSLSQAFD